MSWRCSSASTRSMRLRSELTFQVAMRTRRDYVPPNPPREPYRFHVKPLGQHPLPRHVVAHVSDPHLLAERRLYGVVDTQENLKRAMGRLGRLGAPPQAIVFTGDLADRAEPKAYARLREIVEPAAAALGAEVVWVMGNHDERADYARGLFGEDSD